jgi:hypothetical protein
MPLSNMVEQVHRGTGEESAPLMRGDREEENVAKGNESTASEEDSDSDLVYVSRDGQHDVEVQEEATGAYQSGTVLGLHNVSELPPTTHKVGADVG